MSMHQRLARLSSQDHVQVRRTINTASNTTTNVSIPTIIEIGVCGGLGLLGILLAIIYFGKRRNHKIGMRRKSSVGVNEAEEIRRAIRSTRPPEIDLGKRTSHLGMFGGKKGRVTNAWVDEDGLHGPQSSSAKGFAPGSESAGSDNGWQLQTMPKSASATLPNEPVASPDRPFSPSTTFPVISPPREQQSTDENPENEAGVPPQNTLRIVPYEPPKVACKRRSMSDNQLTYILRSTSQRMRERRGALQRSHSVVSQVSGAPPVTRLPSPPKIHFGGNCYGDSREGLIDASERGRPESANSYATSNFDSIFDNFPTRCSGKSAPWSADHITGKRTPSPSPGSDEDSLCNMKTPDIIIPFHLTSLSKRRASNEKSTNGDEHQPVQICSEDGGAKSAIPMSTGNRKDSRASIQALGYFDIATEQKRSLKKARDLENDPFYSGIVKVGRSSPTRANQNLIGPRLQPVPAYDLQRIHARRGSIIPRSFQPRGPLSAAIGSKLPLTDISGNNSLNSSPIKFQNHFEQGKKFDEQLVNFHLSPLLGHKAPFSGPGITKRQHQGHKRQNVVRMSGLARPRSVCPVPEESDDLNDDAGLSTQELDLSKVPIGRPPLSRLLSNESLARSASRASMASMYSHYSQGLDSVQPPSSAVFEPRLPRLPLSGNTLHESISLNSMRSSPTLGPDHPKLSPSPQPESGTARSSPTMGAYTHHQLPLPEEAGEALDSFGSPSKKRSRSKDQAKRMGRNFSLDYGDAYGSNFTFPPTPSISSDTASDPFSNDKVFSIPVSSPSLNSNASAPPLLTRLHSPESPHRLPKSSCSILLKNITELRRGNSTLSTYSIGSVDANVEVGITEREDARIIDMRGGGISPSKKGTFKAGGRNYLKLSNPSSTTSSPTKKSHSINRNSGYFPNSPRNFPTHAQSPTTSHFRPATASDLNKAPVHGLGISYSTSNTAKSFQQHPYKENESKVIQTFEQEPDASPARSPPQKRFKNMKVGKYPPRQDATGLSSGMLPSSSSISPSEEQVSDQGGRISWGRKLREQQFEFENYSQSHFKNGGFRFNDDDGDDEDYEDEDEDLSTPGEVAEGVFTLTMMGKMEENSRGGSDDQRRASSSSRRIESSSQLEDQTARISVLNLCCRDQKSGSANNCLESGWENCQPSLAPSTGAAISPAMSTTQLNGTHVGSNPDANHSTTTHQNQSSSISTFANPFHPQPTEILFPKPTSLPLTTNTTMNNQTTSLHLSYPKTSRWIWEETTPKISPCNSPSPSSSPSPIRRHYKAHSRNQSSMSFGDGSFISSRGDHAGWSSHIGCGSREGVEGEGEETDLAKGITLRRRGNTNNTAPTVTTLVMERELDMEGIRPMDLEQGDTEFLEVPTNPDPLTSESNDANTSNIPGPSLEETDITDAAALSSHPITTTPPSFNPPISTSTPIPIPTTATPKSHLENIFARHHKKMNSSSSMDIEGQKREKETPGERGSLYDQDGFLKSSPAPAAAGRGGASGGQGWSRSWGIGIKGKR